MKSNNRYFPGYLVNAIRLGFLVHDQAIFSRKSKTKQTKFGNLKLGLQTTIN